MIVEAAVALFVVVVLAGWPWILPTVRALLGRIGVVFTSVRVLSWSSPSPEAQGALLSFNGMEIGHRFFGMVVSQEARLEKPKPKLILEA